MPEPIYLISRSIVWSFIQFIFILYQIEGYRNILKLNSRPLTFMLKCSILKKQKEDWNKSPCLVFSMSFEFFFLHPSKHSSWWRRLQDVLIKTNMFASALRLQKTSSRRLAKSSSRHLQDIFKTYHQVKLFLLTRLWEAFNTFLRRSFPKTVIYRGICLSNTTSDKRMFSVPNLQER